MEPVRNQSLAELLSEVRAAIAFDQPRLTAILGDGVVKVTGEYLLMSADSKFAGDGPMAVYSVEVEFPETFPAAEPRVCEVGGTIPRNADYHVNTNGTCCIGVWEAQTSVKHPMSVQKYFDQPFRNYFFSQHHKSKIGRWPFGELSHGIYGLIEAYAENLSCEPNVEKVLAFLHTMSRNGLKGHWACPCGSGNIIRKCCVEKMAKIRKNVPKEDAQRMLTCLRPYIEQERALNAARLQLRYTRGII